jgi:hypothetical protein
LIDVTLGVTSDRRLSAKTCANSHRLKWDSLPQNDIYMIAQYIRKGEGREQGKDGDELIVHIRRQVEML